jgi:hypothetical protein
MFSWLTRKRCASPFVADCRRAMDDAVAQAKLLPSLTRGPDDEVVRAFFGALGGIAATVAKRLRPWTNLPARLERLEAEGLTAAEATFLRAALAMLAYALSVDPAEAPVGWHSPFTTALASLCAERGFK